MDWLLGLQKLVQGAQTDPQGFALKAASAGIDPSGVEQVLQMQLGNAKLSGLTTGGQPGFDAMVYGGAGTPSTGGLSASPPPGPVNPGVYEMPPITVTAPRYPDQRGSPMLPKGSPWTVMDPKTVPAEAAQASPAPGLTPEQIAKIASLIPRGQVTSGGGGGGGGGFAPRPVQTGQLTVNARPARLGLAQILNGGR